MKENVAQVIAVVVTYNRKELLMECLQAILNQSYEVSRIVLVDNASTDGTQEALMANGYFDSDVMDYHLMPTNTGGAGGFYEGVKIAREYDCSWVWMMDDDTIPNVDCLEQLIEADAFVQQQKPTVEIPSAGKPSFYASTIYGPEGEFMNVPYISANVSRNGYKYWYRFLGEGMVNISAATFVSVLVAKEAIVTCGLPCKAYFIWGDDIEYTSRLTKYYGDAYCVGKSVAIHKRVGAKSLEIKNETNEKRKAMYFYAYRNEAINKMYYGGMKKERIAIEMCKFAIRGVLAVKNKNQRTEFFLRRKGYWWALKKYADFKGYIDGQITTDKA